MALERGLPCPWSQKSEVKSRSSFQALTPTLTFKLQKLGRTFRRTILRTALCSSRSALEGGQEGGLWPRGHAYTNRRQLHLSSHRKPVPGIQPTTQGNRLSFPSLLAEGLDISAF